MLTFFDLGRAAMLGNCSAGCAAPAQPLRCVLLPVEKVNINLVNIFVFSRFETIGISWEFNLNFDAKQDVYSLSDRTVVDDDGAMRHCVRGVLAPRGPCVLEHAAGVVQWFG